MPMVWPRKRQQRPGPTAFVLNISHAGLGAVRSLGRAGIPVVGLDPDPSHAGFASKYCDAKVCPHPVHEPERLVEFLIGQAQRLDQPGVLSPASDAFVLFISRHREQLRPWYRFILPDPEIVEAALDKRRLYDLCDRAGVPHATTYYPETMADVDRIREDLDYPAYIKPYHSHLWAAAFPAVGKGVKVFTSAELTRWFERIFISGVQAMVQSLILGPATNVQSVRVYIDSSGTLLGAFTNRKIRQFPVEFGRATCAESIHDPAFRHMGTRFFQEIGWRGFGLIEFKQDDRDGVLKATDLNPRWLKTVNIATDSGIDFPLMHYRDLAGESPEPQFDFRAGVRWIDAIGDMASSWSLFRAGELTPLDWARSWAGARSFVTFAPDDIGPFLKEYRYGQRLLAIPHQVWRQRRPAPTAGTARQ
jgi:predicted ATP-grasp superfamily ATP-dependent carboligase